MNPFAENMINDILEEYGITTEAKRIKGKEYKYHVGADKDPNDQASSNDENDKNKTDTAGSASLGLSVIDSSVQKRISNIDVEKEKAISESSNIIEEYSAYIGNKLNEAVEKYTTGDNSSSYIEKAMISEFNYLINEGFDDNYINSYLTGNYYGFDDIARKLGYKDIFDYNKNADDLDSKTREKLSNIIRSMLKLRLNYVNKIIQLLSKMIQSNYKQIGLSEQQAKIYLETLSKGDNSSTKAADEIYAKIRDNSEQYEINGGNGYDFRKLGFGCIFGPSYGKLNFAGTDGTNKGAMLNLIQSAMRYDAVIIAHGGNEKKSDNDDLKKKRDGFEYKINDIAYDYERDVINGYYDMMDKVRAEVEDDDFDTSFFGDLMGRDKIKYEAIDIRQYHKKLIENIGGIFSIDNLDIDKMVNTIEEKTKELSKKYTKDMLYDYISDTQALEIDTVMEYAENAVVSAILNKINRESKTYFNAFIGYKEEYIWTCQPTKTLNGGPFIEVNDLVRQLIKEGFKKILIKDCNPGHHRLADDIMKTKGVLINHSDFSNWVESGELHSNDPSLQYLIEAENDLRSLASGYDIDYNDDTYIEECIQWYIDNQEVIQEGVWDTIKEFGKKIITVIIGFFKKIIGYIRLAISKVKELLFGSKEKPKNVKAQTPEIKVKQIDLNAKNIEEFTAKCRDDLNNIWEKTSATISKEIKRQSDLQSKLSKALERDLNKINPSSAKESSNMIDNPMINRYSWLFGDVFDEANLPGVENEDDNDDDDYTVADSNADDNDDTMDDTPDDTPDTGGTDTQDADEPDDNYDVPDAGVDTQDAGDDAPADTPEGGEDAPEGGDDAEGDEDDYTLPDAGEGEDNPEGEEGGEDNPDTEDDDDYDVPDAGEGGDEDNPEGGEDAGTDDTGDDGDLGGDDTEEDVSDDVQIPNLREVQKQLFDQLTPEQQAIKVKELKNNYAELYTRCANILKTVTDSNPGDENMVRVFDYVQKTMTDLQTHIYYYITNTFDTKTYMENDMQFKQFLTILNTIKNILDELNGEKKE